MTLIRPILLASVLATLLLVAPLTASATSGGGTAKIANSDQPSGTLVPEPGAALVFGAGVLVVGVALRRRSRR